MSRESRPPRRRYTLEGYVIEHRDTPEILAGHVVGLASLLTVWHPSPEGFLRWCGSAPDYDEAVKLIRMDQRWRGTVAGRRHREEERSAA